MTGLGRVYGPPEAYNIPTSFIRSGTFLTSNRYLRRRNKQPTTMCIIHAFHHSPLTYIYCKILRHPDIFRWPRWKRGMVTWMRFLTIWEMGGLCHELGEAIGREETIDSPNRDVNGPGSQPLLVVTVTVS